MWDRVAPQRGRRDDSTSLLTKALRDSLKFYRDTHAPDRDVSVTRGSGLHSAIGSKLLPTPIEMFSKSVLTRIPRTLRLTL